MEDAATILKRWAELEGIRVPWDAGWQMAADYSFPRKGNITKSESGPGTNSANQLFDTTAIEGVRTLATGFSSYLTPPGTRWFSWEAQDSIKGDEADAFYNKASEKAAKILAAANFYTKLNEAYLEESGFGLCCIGAMPSGEKVITFQTHPVGSFCIDENADGDVDTFFVRVPRGIRQLVQMFGEVAVTASPKLADSWKLFKEKGVNSKHSVIHAVFPRLERDATKRDNLNMRFASVWVCEDGPYVLQRSGFEEFPFCCTRYAKRSGSDQAYGYGPFEEIKSVVIDANKTKQILRVVGQKLAVPPVLIPDNLVGNVDLRPGGRTVFKSGSGGSDLPREWTQQGRPEGMQDQLTDSREVIRKAYHVPLFEMFDQIERQMTAREVSERSAEKLAQFGPIFTQFASDFQTLMERVFAILFRAGVFGTMDEIPQAVIRQTAEGLEVPPPKVVYQSRIALAIRQTESVAADRFMDRVIQVSQVDQGA
ncbi:MAG: hypothetical protein JWO82_2836, partial [Akkermansiaceae bacterium]|nr:hypothetical protein [Akkermansiaceae bacterium]